MYEEILKDQEEMLFDSMDKSDGQSMKGIIRMFDDDLQEAIHDTYMVAGLEFGRNIVIEKREVSDELQDAIDAEMDVLTELTDIQESTIRNIDKKMAQGISDGLTTAEIQTLLIDAGIFSPMRALRISRTIVGAGSSLGQFVSLDMAGAKFKVWLSAEDAHVRPRHQKMNGEKVGVRERFSNNALYPLDPILPAASRVNCRCSLYGTLE